MGLIQDWLRKKKEEREEKEHYKKMGEFEREIELKKLPSNERALMRFKEEERQKRIKTELEKYNKKLRDEIMYGRDKNPLNAKNIVAGQKELFKGNKNIFSHCPDVVKTQNLFFN